LPWQRGGAKKAGARIRERTFRSAARRKDLACGSKRHWLPPARLMPAASQSLGVLKTMTLGHLPATMIEPLVRAAFEDFGRAGDLTSDAIVPALVATTTLTARQPGVVAGVFVG